MCQRKRERSTETEIHRGRTDASKYNPENLYPCVEELYCVSL